MRILAFTDIHGDLKLLRSLRDKAAMADVVVSTGDFTVFERGAEQVLGMLASFPRPVLLVHGNHENSDLVERFCARTQNLHFLHRRSLHMGELVFLGWGGGGFAVMDHDLERAEAHLARQVAGKPFVFLTHGPPHGTAVDHLRQIGHQGCRSRRAFIEKYQPRLVICGHLHENFGKSDRIGRSIILNPGPQGTFVEVKPLQVVEAALQ